MQESVLDDTDSRHGPVGLAFDAELKAGTLALVWDLAGGIRLHRYRPLRECPTSWAYEEHIKKAASHGWHLLVRDGTSAWGRCEEESARLVAEYCQGE